MVVGGGERLVPDGRVVVEPAVLAHHPKDAVLDLFEQGVNLLVRRRVDAHEARMGLRLGRVADEDRPPWKDLRIPSSVFLDIDNHLADPSDP